MGNAPNYPVAAFLSVLAGILLAKGIEAMLTQGFKKGASWIPSLLGILLFFVGWYWDKITPVLGTTLARGVEAIATNAWAWLGIVLAVIFYSTTTTLLYNLKTIKDLPALRIAVEQYLLPRTLTASQKRLIADYLLEFEPHEITLEVVKHDHEASNYRAEIQKALERGGWTIKGIRQVEDIREGLLINSHGPIVDMQTVNKSATPPPHKLLEIAFQRAGIRIDGAGHGGSAKATEYSLSILIGRRRRDPGLRVLT